jgi:M6 family metalloprotease-like protein
MSFGVYLENVPYKLTQPDGEVLNVFITGDEFFRRVHDSEGYSIVMGNGGWYYYALYDPVADDLIPSQFVVTASRNTVLPMAKGLGISREKYMEKRRAFYEPAGVDISGASKNSTLRNLANSNVKGTQQMNNIVICIGFSDTERMTHTYPYVDGLFNANPNNNMRDYFSTMSYEKLDIVSHFHPAAEEDGITLRFYRSPQPRNYYKVWSPNNPIGYTTDQQRYTREQTLLRDAISWMNMVHPVPQHLNLDIDNNDYCDFITFVVQGDVEGWSDLLWPHAGWLQLFSVTINGKLVREYNFELDGSNWYFNVGVLAHEGYHVLGAPDLYHYNSIEDSIYGYLGQAVGAYDIMESTFSKPQSMSAYMKHRYGNWIPELPMATINKTYEVYPFYTHDGTDPEKPVIHRIPMTGINFQYSVVEYRKRTGTNYDAGLPNEGLMIYRINSTMGGNAGFNLGFVDEVFLYRPGSIQSGSFYTNGNLNQAPFNTANGRTEFNSTTDPKPYRSHGEAENIQDINHIMYHENNDSYTFYYGDPEKIDLLLNKDELVIGKLTGSPGTATVISNVLWHVSIPESASDWLSVSKTMGINNDRIRFVAKSDNNTGVPKSTVVTFTGYGKTKTLTVIQDIYETVCNEEVSNLNVSIDKNTQLATLTWDTPLGAPGAKNTRITLWDNTEGETSVGFTSARWMEGNGRTALADDFDVPEDVSWLIEEIYCIGRQNGSMPLPDFIGIAIYEDNGNNRPKSTPIYEKADFTPEEGVIAGKMRIVPSEPIIISDAGKYWISIYGTYSGPSDKNKQFLMTNTSRVVGDRMCLWDPTGVIHSNYPEWAPLVSSSDLQYGMYFSLSGTIAYPDRILYNIYLDDQLIAADVSKKSFQYPVKVSEDHNWCVIAICTSSMEGVDVCYQTQGIVYDFNVATYPLAGGSVSVTGRFGHGETVIVEAFENSGYKFVNWTQNGTIISTDNPYQFIITEDMAWVANFELVIPFDDYAVTKWDNTFMLNVRKLELDGYDLIPFTCKWYKDGKLVGEDFAYSAGNKVTDLLEAGAVYNFEIATYSRGNVHSTPKIIGEKLKTLRVYPNPAPQGNKLTIEGTVPGSLVEVYNSIGACILRTTATGNVTELTLAVPVGLYVVRSNNEKVKVIIN